MISRRRIVFAFGAGTLAPLASFAQQPQKMRRIGVLSLSVGSSEQAQYGKLLFASWMRRAGYEEGRNLSIEWRYADGDAARLPALAEELVKLNVELIMASFNDAIAAAQRATRTIPIVMFNSLNPVEQGFVQSLARPGGNITGTAWGSPEVAAMLLEVLKEAVPRARRVTFIGHSTLSGTHDYSKRIAEAAGKFGIEAHFVGVERPEEIAKALEQVAATRPQALYVALDTVLMSGLKDIIAFANKRKLPAIANAPQFTDGGGLLSYGPDITELGERTIDHVARILAGARPADLPVELPTKFEQVINLRTAKALGLKIPQSLLIRANRVIE